MHGAVEARYLMPHCRRGVVQLLVCDKRGRVLISSESLLALWTACKTVNDGGREQRGERSDGRWWWLGVRSAARRVVVLQR